MFSGSKKKSFENTHYIVPTPYHDFGKDHVTLEAIDVVVGVADDKEAE